MSAAAAAPAGAEPLPAGLLVMVAVTALALADRITGGRRPVLTAAAYAACAVTVTLWG